MKAEAEQLTAERLTAAGISAAQRREFLAKLPNLSEEYGFITQNDVSAQGFQAHIVGDKYMLCSLPVKGNAQYYGMFNGGSAALLGETTGSIAANLLAREGTVAVGIDISVHHLLPAREGRVYCLAARLNEGRIVNYRLDFYRSDGEQIAAGSHSCTFVRMPE
ncbi:PaaI family thioesterase [Arcanobacterium hippocoleae]